MYGNNMEAPKNEPVIVSIPEDKPFYVWLKPGTDLPPRIKVDIHFTFTSSTDPDESDLGQLHLARSHKKPPNGAKGVPTWSIRWKNDPGSPGQRKGPRPTTNVTITEPDV